jgi:hypothetical protein
MNSTSYKEKCETYKVGNPFDVRVEWYTGDITRETVIADDGRFYYFVFNRNRSWYAPYMFCELI